MTDGVTEDDWYRCVARGRRTAVLSEALRVGVLIAAGLTPLGARFVHLVAPGDDTWRVAAAWLVLLAGVAATGLPRGWWTRRARRVRPELFRPRGPLRQRLARRAATRGSAYLGLVLFVAGEAFNLKGHLVEGLCLIAAGVVIGNLLGWARRLATGKLSGTDRLAAVIASLPGQPVIPVVQGWIRPVANAALLGGFRRRPVIVVAPPIEAALTDRQLRAVLAHELAHARHYDTRRRVLTGILTYFCSLWVAFALWHVPAARALAGLPGHLTGEAGPFLVAVAWLVAWILRTATLPLARAEELAADRTMVELTADPDACIEAITALEALLGTPDTWSLPYRLLFATHPAAAERLQALRQAAAAPVPEQRATRRRHMLLARVTAGATAACLAVGSLVAMVTAGPVMPADAGQYRIVPPPQLEGDAMPSASLDSTSQDAVQLRSSVWGAGAIKPFPGAVPVTAVYDQSGQSWLYVWGAYGKLADPQGELAAFWQQMNPFGQLGLQVYPDAQQAGPLGGYLQCEQNVACAWADDSGIVAVSFWSPQNTAVATVITAGSTPAESQWAALTLQLRNVAEVRASTTKPQATATAAQPAITPNPVQGP